MDTLPKVKYFSAAMCKNFQQQKIARVKFQTNQCNLQEICVEMYCAHNH